MAYTTGTATNPIDLMNELRLFCLAEGITVNQYANDGTYQLLSISFGSGFFTIAYDNRISGATSESYVITQHTAYNSSTAFGSQPNETLTGNGSTRCDFVLGSIPVYHFFYFPGGMLYCSIQLSAGNWTHFGVGDIIKWGTYTGGSMTIGNYIDNNTFFIDDPYTGAKQLFPMMASSAGYGPTLRCDAYEANKMWRLISSIIASDRAYTSQDNTSPTRRSFYRTTPSGTTQATALQTIEIYIRSNIAARSVPVGQLPDCRLINMQFFNPGDTFDNDWLVFPCGVKRDPDIRDDQINTGYFGVALRFQ